ncbi:MauE/DoxX family redox-associated membrane protein [Streptomyces sp. NPDC047725]|uniref:MauE/DoxX family redox-associated membrane protein n=1 Tax=Streptomyces sp. NPDC047725 TaxID=3365487 RepID=UPI00371573DE
MYYTLIAARSLLGVVFLSAALGKVARRRAFGSYVRSLRQMDVVPDRLTRPTAVCVVASELSVCFTLALPTAHTPVVGLAGAAVLLSAFTFAVASALVRGTDARCDCFGTPVPLRRRHLVRNAVLLAFTVTLLVGEAINFLPPGGSHPVGFAVAAATGLVGGVLVVALDDIAALFLTEKPAPLPAPR